MKRLKLGYIDGKRWELLEKVCFGKICVPKGFQTDFASVPRLFRIFFKYSTLYSRASVIHDFLYRQGFKPRKECDLIFLKVMEIEKVSKLKRYIMYYAVRIFGNKYYNNEGENE